MPTHAEMAARCLRDASTFFRKVAGDNPQLKEQFEENATVFEQVADLVEKDPTGSPDDGPPDDREARDLTRQ